MVVSSRAMAQVPFHHSVHSKGSVFTDLGVRNRCAQLLSNVLSAPENVEELVTLALMGACTVEGIVGVATFIREYSIYDKLDQSPEEHEAITKATTKKKIL